MVVSNLRLKLTVVLCLVFLLGVLSLYSKQENSNYYLGVLAEGYPPSLVSGELRYANAQVVSIKDNMVLFGINPETKLTTFMKNLPFLKEVYVDTGDVKSNSSLKKNPLVREFLFLLKKERLVGVEQSQAKGSTFQKTAPAADKVEGSAVPGTVPGKQVKKTAPTGNMALIDQLIREKAKASRAKKSAEKK